MKKQILLLILCLLASCSSLYYRAWEKLGKEKRDLLRDNVIAAREEQKKAGQEFKDALTQLRETYRVPSSKLQKTYDQLKAHYDDLADRYDDLDARISKMHSIATDLFREWRGEADSMQNREFHRRSLEQLAETESRYGQMRAALIRSQDRCKPVLKQFKEYVLFLKHNLNAQAIGGLQAEADDIIEGLSTLIEQMNDSIAETDAFIRTL
jgi:predicted nuclease with TOPRIM domain